MRASHSKKLSSDTGPATIPSGGFLVISAAIKEQTIFNQKEERHFKTKSNKYREENKRSS
jgi:hypothetical protein